MGNDFGSSEHKLATEQASPERQPQEVVFDSKLQRLEQLEKLLETTAHEFNNLLTGLLGYAKLIQLAPSSVTQVTEIAKKIELATERASIRAERLIKLARCSTTENQPEQGPNAEGLEIGQQNLKSDRPQRILLVDDHTMILDVTSKMLQSLGYEVVTARNAGIALRYFDSHASEVDLVIIDLVMPNGGARECFLKLKERRPDLRAILTSGHVNLQAASSALNEGMLGFIQKPYHIKELGEVVRRALKAPLNG